MIEDLKRASWLELFYDVAFVALVAQLTYLAYDHHHTITDLYTIFLVGYTIFIAWWSTTANRNLQPTETGLDKFFIQLQMVVAFCMSLTMTPVFFGDYLGFFLTFGILRLIQAFMLVRMYYLHPSTRPATYNLLEGVFVGSILWIATAFVPAPYHFVVAGTALLVDILTPLTRGKGNNKRYLNVYHLQERLGLFLMLVIGESMIVVALSNTADSFSLIETSIVFSGLFMMIAVWWLYFEHSDSQSGVRPQSLFFFLHAHAFMFGSIILLSVGYKLAITAPRSLEAFTFVAAGSLGVAVTLTVIRLMIHERQARATKMVIGLFCLGAGVLYLGFEEFRTIEATIAITSIFCVAAILDHLGLFESRISKPEKVRNVEA